MPDYNQPSTLIPSTNPPDTYAQQYGGLMAQGQTLNQQQYQSDMDWLNKSYAEYAKAIEADVAAFKPYEQATYQQSLNKTMEGFSARGMLGSGIKRSAIKNYQGQREYNRDTTLRGYASQLANLEMQRVHGRQNVDFSNQQTNLSNQFNQLQFTNTYGQAGQQAIQNYSAYPTIH
jgi:hypothetical protein